MTDTSHKIAVIGLGYVGLPLSCLLSRNYHVIGYERDESKVSAILAGKEIISEPGLPSLLSSSLSSGNLTLTSERKTLKDTDVKIITVGTPFDINSQTTDFSQLDSSLNDLSPYIKNGDIIALKSTVPPGTTEGRVKETIESNGFQVPEDISLVFSPERMVEGQAIRDFTTLPKIVGGSDSRGRKVMAEILSKLGGKVIEVSSAVTAEMVKMIDNYSRFVFIGLTNEIALMSEKVGVDVFELLDAAKNDYPRNSGLLKPGPGVGGSCLNKDPFILQAFMEIADLDLKMVKAAKEVNYGMASHVSDLTKLYSLDRKDVVIGGVAFKGDTNDVRFTTAFEIERELSKAGFKVQYSDPYVQLEDVVIDRDLMSASVDKDIIILLTDHTEYEKIDLIRLKKVMRGKPLIIDTRGVIGRAVAENIGFEYHGIGRL